MPPITRLLIRTAAVHLVAAVTLGVLVVAPGEFLSPGVRSGLSTAAVHLLAVGWITQLIFGVALWMFPRPRTQRSIPRRPLDHVGWALLNLGLVVRVTVEPGWTAAPGGPVWSWSLLLSALLQWAAVLYFAARLWPRVRAR